MTTIGSEVGGKAKNAAASVSAAAYNPLALLIGVPIVIALAGTRLGPFLVLTLVAVLVYQFTRPKASL